MRTSAGPTTLKGPREICLVHFGLEHLKNLEGKVENEKLDLQARGPMVLQFSEEKNWPKRLGPLD